MLHFANQYRTAVDKVLRELLGGAYYEWEEMEDAKIIPEDLVY